MQLDCGMSLIIDMNYAHRIALLKYPEFIGFIEKMAALTFIF